MIAKDKIFHFIVGLVFGLSYYFVALWAVLFGTVIFVGKEVYDIYKPNPTGFDWMDILADYTGFSIGLLIAILIKCI